MKKQLILASIFSALLAGCSSAPSNIIVSPDMIGTSIKNFNHINKSLQLSVSDLRNNSHLVQIMKKGEAAELINGQQNLTNLLQNELKSQLAKQGLSINDFASNVLDISIDKALVTVHQDLMDYKSVSEVVLSAKLNNGDNTLTKTYKAKGSGKGALNADIAVLGRDFNQLLAKAMVQLLSDPQLHEMIK